MMVATSLPGKWRIRALLRNPQPGGGGVLKDLRHELRDFRHPGLSYAYAGRSDGTLFSTAPQVLKKKIEGGGFILRATTEAK